MMHQSSQHGKVLQKTKKGHRKQKKKRSFCLGWNVFQKKPHFLFVVVGILFQKSNLSKTTLPKTNMVILNKLW